MDATQGGGSPQEDRGPPEVRSHQEDYHLAVTTMTATSAVVVKRTHGEG